MAWDTVTAFAEVPPHWRTQTMSILDKLSIGLPDTLRGNSGDADQDIRVAVIGFGKMGILHSAILNLLRPGSVRAVVDASRFMVFGASRLIKNAKFYRNTDEMLKKENPDAVYVTTPTGSHCSIISGLLEADVRHIFVEKPPTTDSRELASLVQRTKSDRLIMVGLQKRFALPFRQARTLVLEKVLGDVQEVSAHIKSGHVTMPTRRFSSIDRGVLLDLGIHVVDLLVWIFGTPKVEACRSVKIHTDVDDQFSARLRTKDDASISMEVTWSAKEYRLPETCIEVHGSKGQLTVTEDYLKVKTADPHQMLNGGTELQVYKPQYYQNLPPVNLSDPEYTLENMHFLSSVQERNEPLTGIKSVAQTMQLIDEMYTMADASDAH